MFQVFAGSLTISDIDATKSHVDPMNNAFFQMFLALLDSTNPYRPACVWIPCTRPFPDTMILQKCVFC